MAKAAKYLPHIYGEKEFGGTQMMKLAAVPFEKLGMPTLPDRSYASVSETMQHTLYGWLAMPLAFLGVFDLRRLKRNIGDDAEETETTTAKK